MTVKQILNSLHSPDGSYYVTLTDGAGNLAPASGGSSGNPNGQATMANSAPVVISSDQSAVPVTLTSTTITGTVAATQSGTWTVQPGNTANTTAWKVDGSAVTQPISGSVTATQATAANLNATVVGTGTFATQLTGATNNINNISGTISLPTGAATSAAQTTMGTNQTVVQAPVAPATATATKANLIAGQYNASTPVFTDGQQGSVQFDVSGNARVSLATTSSSGSDAVSNGSIAFFLPRNSQSSALILSPQAGHVFNGTSWDRTRGDVTGLWVGNEARTTNKTAATNAATVRPIATTIGAAVNKPFQVPELDWSYPAAAGGISNTTTAVTMVAAAGAGIRNYLTAIQVSAGTLGAASEIAVRDGAGGTVIWRGFLSTAGGNQSVNLSSPIKSTANTLLEVVTLTATVTGAVYINAQGYQAP